MSPTHGSEALRIFRPAAELLFRVSTDEHRLKEPEPLPSPITLSTQSTLKLSFSVVDVASSSGLVPSQSTILFEDAHGDTARDVYLPLNIKPPTSAGGKVAGSFVLNMAKPPYPLAHSAHGSYKVSLILSSLAADTTPLLYPLGEVRLAQEALHEPLRQRHDLPPRQGEPAFRPQQELFHTFRQDEGTVGTLKTGVGMALVLGPWAVLLLLVRLGAPVPLKL